MDKNKDIAEEKESLSNDHEFKKIIVNYLIKMLKIKDEDLFDF